jgi:hypothetical protein
MGAKPRIWSMDRLPSSAWIICGAAISLVSFLVEKLDDNTIIRVYLGGYDKILLAPYANFYY